MNKRFDMPRYDHDKKVLEKNYSLIITSDMHIYNYYSNQEERYEHIVFSAGRKKVEKKLRGWRETTLPASDVADDEGRRDNTGVGIATLSTAAGFLLVIILQVELSILL